MSRSWTRSTIPCSRRPHSTTQPTWTTSSTPHPLLATWTCSKTRRQAVSWPPSTWHSAAPFSLPWTGHPPRPLLFFSRQIREQHHPPDLTTSQNARIPPPTTPSRKRCSQSTQASSTLHVRSKQREEAYSDQAESTPTWTPLPGQTKTTSANTPHHHQYHVPSDPAARTTRKIPKLIISHHPFNTQPTQTPPPVCTTNTNGSSINNKATSWRPSAITSRRFKEFKGSFLAPQKKDTTTCPVHSDPQNHRRYQKEGMERTILSFRFSSSAGRQQEQDAMCWAS